MNGDLECAEADFCENELYGLAQSMRSNHHRSYLVARIEFESSAQVSRVVGRYRYLWKTYPFCKIIVSRDILNVQVFLFGTSLFWRHLLKLFVVLYGGHKQFVLVGVIHSSLTTPSSPSFPSASRNSTTKYINFTLFPLIYEYLRCTTSTKYRQASTELMKWKAKALRSAAFALKWITKWRAGRATRSHQCCQRSIKLPTRIDL